MNNSCILFLARLSPLLLNGLVTTILLSVASIFIGFLIGTLLGIALSERLRVPIFAPLLASYVFCVRSIPFFVQLLLTYFVIPDLLGIELSPFCAGALALGNCSTGYVAEIIRSGINTVPVGQWEASRILGYNTYATLKHIILPQVFACSLPALFNEFISVILSTSIISQIGVLELTKVGSNIIAREMNPLAIYTILAALYLVITSIVSWTGKYLERRLRYGYRS